MAAKMSLFVLASLLLLAVRVSSDKEEFDERGGRRPPEVPPEPAPVPARHIIPVEEKECPGLCEVRCSKHSRPNHCHRVCQTCCRRCRCVPPGTAGNREMCGVCYTNMTTHRNATKCP